MRGTVGAIVLLLSSSASTFLLALLSWSALVASLQYQIVRDYSGNTFFDGWDFYGHIDNLTWGNVTWVSQADATSDQLAYLNAAGNIILKVDNTTDVLSGDLRNSVRITTQDTYDLGTVWMIDLVHLPFGCSVWPAFWSKGQLWPDDGEIDIIEGINGMQSNQMAIHTLPGCTHSSTEVESGRFGLEDCAPKSGCTVVEAQANSYADAFASAGGGVWATKFDSTGIFIWFWSRPNIPASITQSTSTSSVDDSDWGIPSASYSSTTCDIRQFFTPQNIVLDTTLCGEWAGISNLYSSTCGSAGLTGLCYNDSVVGPGSKFDDAYFEVRYVRVYSNVSVPSSTTTAVTSLYVNTPSGSGTDVSATPSAAKSGCLSMYDIGLLGRIAITVTFIRLLLLVT